MARRRTRWRRNRQSPDMGWFISEDEVFLNPDGVSKSDAILELFRFDDIDSDQAGIGKQKSDWFIKRVIVDVYSHFNAGGTWGQFAGCGFLAYSMGTMTGEEVDSVNIGLGDQMSADGYDQWSRLFRTWTRPTYRPSHFPVESTGALSAKPSGPQDYRASALWFGESYIRDDFQVSNAGLRPEDIVVMWVSTLDTFAARPYLDGDQVAIKMYARTLLQKRR